MRDGPRGFPQNSSCSAVLRCRLTSDSRFRVRDCHPLWSRFPACSAIDRLRCCRRSYNPGRCQRQPRFGLLRVRSPLLAQSFLLSFPVGTKMFQFPTFAPGFRRVSGSLPTGFPIRTSAGHRAFAPHRGFSQLVTSFFASESHRHPPCALVHFLCFFRPAPTRLRATGADLFAYIRLARFFRFSQLKSLRFSSFCVPTMSMISLKVENNGFEPLTPCLQSRCSTN